MSTHLPSSLTGVKQETFKSLEDSLRIIAVNLPSDASYPIWQARRNIQALRRFEESYPSLVHLLEGNQDVDYKTISSNLFDTLIQPSGLERSLLNQIPTDVKESIQGPLQRYDTLTNDTLGCFLPLVGLGVGTATFGLTGNLSYAFLAGMGSWMIPAGVLDGLKKPVAVRLISRYISDNQDEIMDQVRQNAGSIASALEAHRGQVLSYAVKMPSRQQVVDELSTLLDASLFSDPYTVRNNILYGLEHNPVKYDSILRLLDMGGVTREHVDQFEKFGQYVAAEMVTFLSSATGRLHEPSIREKVLDLEYLTPYYKVDIGGKERNIDIRQSALAGMYGLDLSRVQKGLGRLGEASIQLLPEDPFHDIMGTYDQVTEYFTEVAKGQ